MAEVYKGYHAALDRYVAIKVLHPFLADDPEFKDRFEKEARNVARLRHPNIVQVFDFDYDQAGDSYYMVMELINGPTLKDKLFDLASNDQKFSLPETIRIIRDSANALAYAHKRSMIHRDVKPANLMLNEDGNVVLTDFGIAKIVTSAQFTASGGMVGTPAYMAPEQGLGEAGDERSDIYSLGVIFYQMLTGRLPYDADTPLAVILKHVNEPIPDIRRIEPDTPEWIAQMVMQSMAKAPDDRYSNAEEFLTDLNQTEPASPTTRGVAPRDLLAQADSPRRQVQVSGSIFDTARKTGTATQILGAAAAKQETNTPNAATATDEHPAVSTAPARRATATMPAVTTTPVPAIKSGGGSRWLVLLLGSLLIMITATATLVIMGQEGEGPFASVFGSDDDTPTPEFVMIPSEESTPQATEPVIEFTETPQITPSPTVISPEPPTQTPTSTLTRRPTRRPTLSPTASPSATLTASSTPTNTATFSPTATVTAGPSATPTATQTPSFTPSPTLSPTATISPTERPSVREVTENCDLNYSVIAPERLERAPSLNNQVNARLVRAEEAFEFDLIIENASTCDLPSSGALELTFIPDFVPDDADFDQINDIFDLTNCNRDRIFTDVNFTGPQRPRIIIDESVQRGRQITLTFNGEAPSRFGCHFGAWQLQFANYDGLKIGDPIFIAIQVFGGLQ